MILRKCSDLSINVYDIQTNEQQENFVYVLKVTKKERRKRHINLLLTENNQCQHYSTTAHFSRLVQGQYTKHKSKHEYCYSCLQGFQLMKNEYTREQCEDLMIHQNYCRTLTPQRVQFPSDEEKF